MDVYEQIKEHPISEFWKIRLGFEPISQVTPEAKEKKFNLFFTIIASLAAGTLVRIADIFGEINIQNNLAFFVLPLLCIYYMLKNKAEAKNIVLFSAVTACCVLFMNLITWDVKSDTRLLSSMHFIFIMWAFVGLAFTSFDLNAREKQMQFLRRNGDVVVLTGIIIICGMFLTALTQGLFSIIGIRLTEEVFKNIAMYGLAASSIVANYMIESSPKIINKVTPFISKIFTPLILILMTAFLIVLTFFAKDPFTNRQELIVFNVLLALNMGVIIFSFTGNKSRADIFQNKVLLVLSGEALIINIIALSSIIYRIFMFGITPNRAAVLGANVLLFINLILIAVKLIGYVRSKLETEDVHKSMTMMLPWYTVWAVIVAFAFPFIFWFK
jgi:hypothetical protein